MSWSTEVGGGGVDSLDSLHICSIASLHHPMSTSVP